MLQPAPVGSAPVQSAQTPNMRWVPGPSPAQPSRYAPPDQPISLSPPGSEPGVKPSAASLPDDIPDDAVLPRGRAPTTYSPQRAYGAPTYQSPPQRAVPPLGPSRAPQMMAAAGPAALTPAATLACPIVSALDHWVSDGVQPAAMRWFGSAGRRDQADLLLFVPRNGRVRWVSAFPNMLSATRLTSPASRSPTAARITVQEGWHGTPEEQGFLHDVQLAACDNFTTVLAPGYNAAHYNHIHVDLMRRSSGDRPCRPEAISGEVVAARARAVYARQHGPGVYRIGGQTGHEAR